MLTYQDFLEVGDNPEAIADFISDVIADHEASEKFKIGQIAGEFYRGEDRYIAELKKMIYDIVIVGAGSSQRILLYEELYPLIGVPSNFCG